MEQRIEFSSINDYLNDSKKQIEIFTSESKALAKMHSQGISPYPFALDKETNSKLINFTKVLEKAIHKVITNYGLDEAIQNLIPLSSEIKALVQQSNKKAYQLGPYRPDFLIDENQNIRICEINGRFTTNGFYLSHFLSEVDRKINKKSYSEKKLSIPECFQSSLEKSKTIVILKSREKGYDIHEFYQQCLDNNKNISFSTGTDLIVKNDLVYNKQQIIDQFILELHQDELLSLPAPILRYIANNPSPLADLRTIFIGHDKRLLAVLTDQEIMKKYLSQTEIDELIRYLIPSYTLNKDDVRSKLLAAPKHWVLKKATSGKGKGMLLGNSCDMKLWQQTIENNAAEYMVQPNIKQKAFPIIYLKNNKLEKSDMQVVGCLPSFGAHSFGAGIFRASTSQVVNVGSGGLILTANLIE